MNNKGLQWIVWPIALSMMALGLWATITSIVLLCRAMF